jgi:hypothetical protein
LQQEVANGTSASALLDKGAASDATVDPASRRLAAEGLAIEQEYQTRQRFANQTKLQSLQDEQTAETRLDEDTLYNLSVQKTTEDRNHADRLLALQQEGTVEQRNAQAEDEDIQRSQQLRDRYHTIEQWQLEDTRLAADRAYTDARAADALKQTALQSQITSNNTLISQAQSMVGFYQQLLDKSGGLAGNWDTILSGLLALAGGGGGSSAPATRKGSFLARLG